MNRPTNYLPNRVGAENYQTFQITAPIQTHTRRASCEEVRCVQYLNGWRTKLDLNSEQGQRQAYYIKHHSGRSYKVVGQENGLVVLEFRGNQECFQEHRVPLDRPAVYRVKGGDHRGNPLRTLTRVHKKPEFWVEEFAEHQDKINEIRKKG